MLNYYFKDVGLLGNVDMEVICQKWKHEHVNNDLILFVGLLSKLNFLFLWPKLFFVVVILRFIVLLLELLVVYCIYMIWCNCSRLILSFLFPATVCSLQIVLIFACQLNICQLSTKWNEIKITFIIHICMSK